MELMLFLIVIVLWSIGKDTERIVDLLREIKDKE